MTPGSDQPCLEQMVARLTGPTGDRQLVSLTREELYGVGDDPVLGHAADLDWRDGLTERAQALVLETAQRGLVARSLLVPDGDGELVVTDEVRVSCSRLAALPRGSWCSPIRRCGPRTPPGCSWPSSGCPCGEPGRRQDTARVAGRPSRLST